MTSNIDIVKAYLSEPIAERLTHISDDFVNVDRDGNVVMDKAGWDGMTQMLLNSFEDFDYVVSNIREEGGAAIVTARFEGKFVNDLDLSALGAGVVPATGKKIVWPEWDSKLVVEGNKITRIEEVGEGGGIGAFLAPLGVTPPAG